MYFDAKIVSALNIGSTVSQLLHFFSEISSTTVCGHVSVGMCEFVVSLCVCVHVRTCICVSMCVWVFLYFLALQEASGLSSIFSPQITTSARSLHVFYWKIVSACWIASVVSNSLWPRGLQPTRFLCLRDSSGNSIRVSCHVLVQGIFLIKLARLLHPKLAGGFFITSATWEAPGE